MAKRYSRGASKDVKSALHRRKKGTLKSGKGGKGGTVKSRKQAIAIGLSEARKKGKKVPKRKGGQPQASLARWNNIARVDVTAAPTTGAPTWIQSSSRTKPLPALPFPGPACSQVRRLRRRCRWRWSGSAAG